MSNYLASVHWGMSRTDSPPSDESNETETYPSDYRDDDTDASTWSRISGAWNWGWPSDYWWNEGEEAPDSGPGEEADGWVDEGFFALLVAVGLILFVVPEPGTSTVGILLMLTGTIAWVFDTVTENGS